MCALCDSITRRVHICMCVYVCMCIDLGMLVCLYTAKSPYEVDRPKNIMLTIKRTHARIRKYGKGRRQMPE